MTNDKIQEILATAALDHEPWGEDSTCPKCAKALHCEYGLEPIGLCADCKSTLVEGLVQGLEVVHAAYGDVVVQWAQALEALDKEREAHAESLDAKDALIDQLNQRIGCLT